MKRLNHKAEHKRHLPEPSARLHQQIGLPERPAFPNVLPNPPCAPHSDPGER